jgi:DNA (cytosine-5)-methyltransferase 1
MLDIYGNKMAEISYIDLFAGAGGLSEGFVNSGMNALAHVELDKAACFTLKTRVAYHYLSRNGLIEIYNSYLKGDIKRDELYSNIPSSELSRVINEGIGPDNSSIFSKVDSLIGDKTVDLIIGGPPCQAYSIVGRAPLKHKANDERTSLYIYYGRFLKRYSPKAFVFENVPGLLSSAGGQYFKNLKKYYKRLGYEVGAEILNARDYNVVQNRKRVIIIGWKKDLAWSYPQPEKKSITTSRSDIFEDLPNIGCGEKARTQHYSKKPNKYLVSSGIRNGLDYVAQHVTRPHNEKDLKIYELAIRYLNEGRKIKNSDIPEKIRTQKNVRSFLDRFKVVDDTPHTLIAHIAKDGHHFIHPDISQKRSISVREAARIQSFPDNYFFEGVDSKAYRSAAFRQIGNAVPPLLAQKIAEELYKRLLND